MKKRVSADLRSWRYGVWVVLGVTFFVGIVNIVQGKTDVVTLSVLAGLLLLFSVSGYFLYRFLNRAKTVEFDASRLFISHGTEVKIIHYNQIVSLRVNSLRINDRYTLRMTYRDENGETSVVFLPRLANLHLSELKALLIQHGIDVNGFWVN